MEELMGRRSFFLIGLAALLFIAVGCAGPNRLERDFGNSFNLAISNQILNPEAGKNIEPVSGLDGEAAQAILEKYRKDFEKPPAPVPYTLSIGTGGNK
jgi:type IV pilus biogenesis protein CpaD/CtpE